MRYQGKPHVLTIARDVTEKKRSATELARQRETLYQREKLAALGSLLAGRRPRAQQSAVGRRGAGRAARGARRSGHPGRGAEDPRRRRALRAHRAHVPRHGPAAAARTRSGDHQRRRDGGAGHDRLRHPHQQHRRDAGPRARTFRRRWPTPTSCTRCCSTSSSTRSSRCRSGRRRAGYAWRPSTLPRADMIRITVADNGPGIPPHLRARIFEPYFTTKPTGMGLGVGLAVSLGIVEAHGGTLTVDSPAEGGAAFHHRAARGRRGGGRGRGRRRARSCAATSAGYSSSTTRRKSARRWRKS